MSSVVLKKVCQYALIHASDSSLKSEQKVGAGVNVVLIKGSCSNNYGILVNRASDVIAHSCLNKSTIPFYVKS
jgi:hypothetical protein